MKLTLATLMFVGSLLAATAPSSAVKDHAPNCGKLSQADYAACIIAQSMRQDG